MHEYSIVDALVARAESEAAARGATAIHRVVVRVGELSGVEIPLLRTAWETFRVRSACRSAELDVQLEPVRWTCRACDAEVPLSGPRRCASCGGAARLGSGDEIILVRLEMEV